MDNELNNPALDAVAKNADAIAAPAVAAAAPQDTCAAPAASISQEQIAGAMPDAVLMVGMVAEVVEKKYGVGLRDETRDTAAKKLAPLLVKYDVESPWLRRWRYEIDALMFLGATAYGIWRAKKAADEEAAGSGDGSGK